MEQRLTIVTLGVNDLKIASDFYENKFGWKKTKSSNEHIVFFQLNGILLSLYPRKKLADDANVSVEGSGFEGLTLAYNTRTKEDVDELIETLENKGVKIVKRPEDAVWGGYSSYVADMDDNLWEIAFNPFLSLDENGNTSEE
ncbi:MAG: VOC family protein [Algibacter sp.]|uniref:VOC family protein n=1 Tax=Algibacter sp. TaxID=1872428 RepID=UPI002618D191|nr:VOC family protein [Algibacter sp.]MDG1728455.1 VOC family protein [Algibacter sp.]MDG2178141.1 VOC family protein [Algibacter sp.]